MCPHILFGIRSATSGGRHRIHPTQQRSHDLQVLHAAGNDARGATLWLLSRFLDVISAEAAHTFEINGGSIMFQLRTAFETAICHMGCLHSNGVASCDVQVNVEQELTSYVCVALGHIQLVFMATPVMEMRLAADTLDSVKTILDGVHHAGRILTKQMRTL